VPIVNPHPQLGLSHSLRLGVAAVPPETAAAVLLLGDQPTLDPEVVRRVVAKRATQPMVAAAAGALLGPPVLLERSGFGLVEQLDGDIGLREVIRDSAEVAPVDVGAHAPDVDTPADLAHLSGTATAPARASIEELQRRRERLRARLTELSALSARGIERAGEWRLPTVVAHLARWDAVAAKELEKHLAGRPTTDYSDYEAWNRLWEREDAAISMHDALERWDAAFDALIERVRSTPAERWDARASEWLNGCTLDHHADHLASLDEG
jgi:muconolactone delta-isomerase